MNDFRVLITGGAGYIGSCVNALLNTLGVKTLVVDSLIYGHKEALNFSIIDKFSDKKDLNLSKIDKFSDKSTLNLSKIDKIDNENALNRFDIDKFGGENLSQFESIAKFSGSHERESPNLNLAEFITRAGLLNFNPNSTANSNSNFVSNSTSNLTVKSSLNSTSNINSQTSNHIKNRDISPTAQYDNDLNSHANFTQNSPSNERIFTINFHANSLTKFIQANLCDKEALREIFKMHKISAVLHFAAFAYVGESVINPAKYYTNNVSNTINLLEIMREFSVKNIVFSSTCATYGIPSEIPIKENHPQKPINPYGRSKLMIEQILQDYAHAYDFKFVILRYFNAAGASHFFDIGEAHSPETHLIPLILQTALGKRAEFSVFGTDYDTKDGSCIRDYIHIDDLASAHILALKHNREFLPFFIIKVHFYIVTFCLIFYSQ